MGHPADAPESCVIIFSFRSSKPPGSAILMPPKNVVETWPARRSTHATPPHHGGDRGQTAMLPVGAQTRTDLD